MKANAQEKVLSESEEEGVTALDLENQVIVDRNLAHFQKLMKAGNTDEVLKFIWAVYDTDRSGYLDQEEAEILVRSILCKVMGFPFSQERFIELFQDTDKDGSGTIEKPEMGKLLQSIMDDAKAKHPPLSPQDARSKMLKMERQSNSVPKRGSTVGGKKKLPPLDLKSEKGAAQKSGRNFFGKQTKSTKQGGAAPMKIQHFDQDISDEENEEEIMNLTLDEIQYAPEIIESKEPIVRRRDLNNYEYESSSEGESDDGGGLVDLFEKNPFGGLMQIQEQVIEKKVATNKIPRVSEDDKAMRGIEPPVYDIMKQGGNPNFENYAELFKNLTNNDQVKTQYDIVSAMITYDSTRVVTCTKDDDIHYVIKQYDLTDYNKSTFEEHYRGQYIKMKDIEQNSKGDYYHVVYMDDGKFRIRHFGKDSDINVAYEGPCQKADNNANAEGYYFDINKNPLLNMNDFTIPIAGFSDPYITSAFIDNDRIFVSLFHNVELKHYQFIYSIKQNNIISKIEKMFMGVECSRKNFPYKTFYNYDDHEIYTFYRQGQAFSLKLSSNRDVQFNGADPNDVSDHRFEDIYDNDLGQMFLFNNKALVARSSSKIIFFKQEKDEVTQKVSWKNYHEIKIRGFIYFIKGNKRIQITTDEKIFFYLIKPENDYMPELENCMNNFMQCSQMMFGSAVKYGVTFKTNQKDFNVYTRKFTHDFKVCVAKSNYEGCIGLNVKSEKCILVSDVDVIKMYDSQTWQEVTQNLIQVKLLPSQTRERNEIIAMNICPYEKYLGVITGKNLIKSAQKPNQLFIFKKSQAEGSDAEGIKNEFRLISKGPIKIGEMPQLQGICMDFHFKLNPISQKSDTIIFAQRDRIIKYNFKMDRIMNLHIFSTPLNKQPEFFRLNDTQKICMIASQDDSLYLDLSKKGNHKEIDIDDEFQISAIRSIMQDEGSFYILANKARGKLGMYLLRMDEKNPIVKNRKTNVEELNGEWIVNMGNKLDIADASMLVLKNEEHGYKELIISYKTMYINTYTINVVDLSDKLVIFRHESFQLWESQIKGFLSSATHDFVTLSKDGICIVGLGTEDARQFKDQEQKDVMLHSLESTNYLKVEPNNHILIQDGKEEKLIKIQEQVTDSSGETQYDNILQICLNQVTLRELLVLQSLYLCKTQTDMIELVQQQPNPSVFYKTFLELDKTNMLNIMAFDSKSMNILLNDDFSDYYTDEFPVFYMNKYKVQTQNAEQQTEVKVKYRNAIDIALKNNQISAVIRIVWYITKYQNNFVSSFLFINNLPKIMEKGIFISDLLTSEVFKKDFDFDEWPQTHTYNAKMLMPYNGSMFQLIDKYDVVFGHELSKPKYDFNRKMYKIKYTLNILPIVGEHYNDKNELVREDIKIMDLCQDSEELCLFDTTLIMDIIAFKWQQYARDFHYFGAIMHFFYLFTIMIYVKQVYVENALGDYTQTFAIFLAVGIFYPAFYDISQMIKEGSSYWNDSWNYSDFINIWSGILNIGLQLIMTPFTIAARANMILVVFMLLMKTFFFLRIFENMSYIVTMLRNVVYDLRIFLSFYAIITVLFSLVIGILGIGNFNLNESFAMLNQPDDDGYFGQEYKQIGLFIGNVFQTLRISMGDYEFDGANYLEEDLNRIYWFCWFLIVSITCIIFLNFIIAEASESYARVTDHLSEMIMKERASLIVEAETMLPVRMKTKEMFPQFIVIRQCDE